MHLYERRVPLVVIELHVCISATRSGLRDQVMDQLDGMWHPDFTFPRIFTVATAQPEIVASGGRWLARVASQHGILSPVFDLNREQVLLEPTCKHRFGVVDLPLQTTVPADSVLYPIGMWTRVAPRSRRWMMRISPQLDLDIVMNAERANPVLILQAGQLERGYFALISPDLIAAEVVSRAIRAAAMPEDWDGITPWQHPQVQIAIERHIGIRSGAECTLVVHTEDHAEDPGVTRLVGILERAAQLVDMAHISGIPTLRTRI